MGYFLEMTPEAQATKSKNRRDYIKLKMLLQSKQQSEEAIYRMGEHIWKPYIW